jgi:hypothetical protein
MPYNRIETYDKVSNDDPEKYESNRQSVTENISPWLTAREARID